MELLPCPFCLSFNIAEGFNKYYGDYYTCWNCHCKCKKQNWNNRQTPWISVKDRLPKQDEIVIACTDSGNDTYAKFLISTYDYNFEEWCDIHVFNVTIRRPSYPQITHWMPLPSLPEEK